jgi:hypothetical protein
VRSLSQFWSASFVVVGSLVGCNLHSGPGIDPDEIVDGGAQGTDNDGGIPTGSGSGTGGPGSSSGTSGSSSGGQFDASLPALDGGSGPEDATVDVNGSCESDAGACLMCCTTSYPGGTAAFEKVATNCLCGASGACSSECANEFCNGQPFATASDPCQLCVQANLSPSGTCGQECAGAGCEPIATCIVGCPAAQ